MSISRDARNDRFRVAARQPGRSLSAAKRWNRYAERIRAASTSTPVDPTFLTAFGSPVVDGASITMPAGGTNAVYVNNGIVPNSDTGKYCVGFKLVSGAANVSEIITGFKRLAQFANTSTFYLVSQKITAATVDYHYNSLSGNNGNTVDQSPGIVFNDGDIFISCIDTGLAKAYHYINTTGWLTQNTGTFGGDPNDSGPGFTILSNTIECGPRLQVLNGAGGSSEWEYISEDDVPAGFTLMTAAIP